MRRLLLGVIVTVLLAGCTADVRYQTLGSPDPMGAPIRYPLDYPICYPPPEGGKVFVPLRIRLFGAGIPDPVRVMSLRRKDPTADGCDIYRRRSARRPGPSVRFYDSQYAISNSGWQPLDMTGRGYFSAVAYKLSILNADDLRKEAEREEKVAGYRLTNLAKFGETNGDVVLQDETLTINGRVWRHRLIAKYTNVTDLGNIAGGDLAGWRDVYEHQIDETHVLRRIGRYDAMVVADPEWIDARRELTRKMVEAVRIEKMTPAEVDAAVAEYNRRREQGRDGTGRQ